MNLLSSQPGPSYMIPRVDNGSNVNFPILTTSKLTSNLFRRDKFTIHSRAVVCQDVELKGDITIGPGHYLTL